MVTFKAETQREAFAHGQALFDRAKSYGWHRGELVRVEIQQADE